MFHILESHVRATYRLYAYPNSYLVVHCQEVSGKCLARKLVKTEEEFVEFAKKWNGLGDLFCGRNPRDENDKVIGVRAVTFDLDAVREKKEATSEEQIALCRRAAMDLLARYPGGLCVFTGNGFHLLYVSDGIIADDIKGFERRYSFFNREVLGGLSPTDPIGSVRPGTLLKPYEGKVRLDDLHDSARLDRIVGTVACKGQRKICKFLGFRDCAGSGRELIAAIQALPGDVGEVGVAGDVAERKAGIVRKPEGAGSGLVPHGKRHLYLVSIAGSLRRKGLGEEAIFQGVKAAYEDRCEKVDGDSDEKLRALARSMLKYAPEDVGSESYWRDVGGNGGNGPGLLRRSGDAAGDIKVRSPAASLSEYKNRLAKRGESVTPELPTGYPQLDSKTWGLRRGEIMVVGARPAQGKSSWCVNVALNLCRSGKKVLYASTEMSWDAMTDRCVSVATGISGEKFLSGLFTIEERQKVEDFLAEFATLPFHLYDGFEPSSEAIKAAVEKCDPDVLIFDHVQHIGAGSVSKYAAISAFIRDIKALALERNMAVIVTSQLRRPTFGSPQPNMSDLKECGTLEEEAAQVVLMYPSAVLLDDSVKVVTFDMVKNRHGSLVEFDLAFEKACTRFKEVGK